MFCDQLFLGFQTLQLGMMGTTLIFCSGDNGVAGLSNNGSQICQNSTRMSWTPCSCFVLTFVYEDQTDGSGNGFNPQFPVRADLASFIPNDAFVYFSLRVRT